MGGSYCVGLNLLFAQLGKLIFNVLYGILVYCSLFCLVNLSLHSATIYTQAIEIHPGIAPIELSPLLGHHSLPQDWRFALPLITWLLILTQSGERR